MKKNLLSLLVIALFFTGCNKEPDPYAVSKNTIGLLTDSTQVKNLKTAFPNDSIVNYKGDKTFRIPMNKIEIYDKKGSLLLTLTPDKLADSTATITHIQISDARYKTEKGISSSSRFKDIQNTYKISKIDNLINLIVVSVNDIDAQFAIDKKELPANLRYDMNMKIEASQIPDNARIKYFFINW